MELTRATIAQVKRLTEISKAAFDSDLSVGAPGPGGPPGYDEEKWLQQQVQQGAAYAIVIDDVLIGGALVFRDRRVPSVMELGRVFIDPAFHRQGQGLAAMHALERHFPDIQRWRLDTPSWNTRTRAFYEKLGYVITRRSRGFLFMQKDMA
ncbi:MAG: GNAT family N-acetyltransferase [Uliginosibacterium sp.]|nr:GNAT family N-acetyltransferase [Uliginosibacterium sp.]